MRLSVLLAEAALVRPFVHQNWEACIKKEGEGNVMKALLHERRESNSSPVINGKLRLNSLNAELEK